MSYQGHLPDGSSVRKHSAGSCYPYVVFGQETPNGVQYGVMNPDGTSTPACFSAANLACGLADARAAEDRAAKAQRAAEFNARMAPGGWGVV